MAEHLANVKRMELIEEAINRRSYADAVGESVPHRLLPLGDGRWLLVPGTGTDIEQSDVYASYDEGVIALLELIEKS